VSPVRRLWQNPVEFLAPHVLSGMTVLEPGPAMGFFTLELARLVGGSGRVIAVDVEPKMIERLKQRARKAGLSERIDARIGQPASMKLDALDGTIDFANTYEPNSNSSEWKCSTNESAPNKQHRPRTPTASGFRGSLHDFPASLFAARFLLSGLVQGSCIISVAVSCAGWYTVGVR
jgi:SAM-dependent methyltransferase